jgi:hypothetical protein
MSAAKAGVPINPATAITVASFFMSAPKNTSRIYTMQPAGRLLPLEHSEGKSGLHPLPPQQFAERIALY